MQQFPLCANVSKYASHLLLRHKRKLGNNQLSLVEGPEMCCKNQELGVKNDVTITLIRNVKAYFGWWR